MYLQGIHNTQGADSDPIERLASMLRLGCSVTVSRDTSLGPVYHRDDLSRRNRKAVILSPGPLDPISARD